MTIDEEKHAQMMRALDAANDGLWQEIVSEIQDDGTECPVWVLVHSSIAIYKAYEVILSVSEPYRRQCEQTSFSISFDQLVEGAIWKWNYITAAEIASGNLRFPLAIDHTVHKPRNSVFERVREAMKPDRA